MKQRWPLLVILLAAAIWFYRSPYSASDLEIIPDSEEYAIGALELLETGNYHLTIENRWLPPRYPPWFSATVILPAYVAFGHEVGNAVLPITALGIAGIGCAWAIGRQISGIAGATFAALALAVLPIYSTYAQEIMTDVPCAALTLLTCVIYLRIYDRPTSLKLFATAGVVIAMAALFRNLFAAMLLPLVLNAARQRNGRVRRLIALLTPMLFAGALTCVYNVTNFGSPFRNGYKFWAAAPYDYLPLTFSPSYLAMNLSVLWQSAFPVALIIAVIAAIILRALGSQRLRESGTTLRNVITFFALSLAPIVALHLVYFFPAQRFFLPLLSAAVVLAAALVAMLLGARAEQIAKLLVIPVLLLAVGGRIATSERVPFRRIAAERIRNFTPDDATVISIIDPLYLGRFAARGSHRRIVPLSRDVEYASKLLVRNRIAHPDPPLRRGAETRPPGLLRGGAEDAVKFVATEQLGVITREVDRGAAVYADLTGAGLRDKRALDALSQHFRFEAKAPDLYQLLPR